MDLVVAIGGLAGLILIHEAGHFFTALATGMRPRRFFVGLPPALVSVKRNGVEYGIGAIPFGGYVKIPGMHRPSPSDVDLYFGLALREEPSLVPEIEALKRVLAAGKHDEAKEALAQLEAAIERVEITPQALRAAKRGFVEIADGLGGDAYWRQRTWKRVAVIFAGPATNLVFAVVLFAILFMQGNAIVTTSVAKVSPNRPAASAGLRPGDRIVAIDGQRVKKPDQIHTLIAGSKGKAVWIAVQRGDRLVVLGPVKPRKESGTYLVGFELRGRGLSFPAAAWRSIRVTGEITRETARAFTRLAHGQGRKDLSGPVGIVQASSNALDQGLLYYLQILGLISLSLAILNMLPLLPLDGGHIAFSIVEGIRGRAIRREVYERVSMVGIVLVLFLFFIGLSSDIGRLRGG